MATPAPRYWSSSTLTMEQWLIQYVGLDKADDGIDKLGLFVGGTSTTADRLLGLIYNGDAADLIDPAHDDNLFERTELSNTDLFKFIPVTLYMASISELKYGVYFDDNFYAISKAVLDPMLTGIELVPIEPEEIPYGIIPDDRVDISYLKAVVSVHFLYNLTLDQQGRPTGDDITSSIIADDMFKHVDICVPYVLIDGIKEAFTNAIFIENVDPVAKPWLEHVTLSEILFSDINTYDESLVRRFVWDVQRTFNYIDANNYDLYYGECIDYIGTLVNRIWDEHNYNALLEHFPSLRFLREETYVMFYRMKMLVNVTDTEYVEPTSYPEYFEDLLIVTGDIAGKLDLLVSPTP